MKKLLIVLVAAVFLAAVIIAGCLTAKLESEQNTTQAKEVSKKVHESEISDNESAKISTNRVGSQNVKDNDDNYFYNIRIVTPSNLEELQKEMKSDEYIVKNDNGYSIGIVSSRELVLRGDLVQLEENSVNSETNFDKTDVATHLTDIVFGSDNAKLSLFKSDKDYQFWFNGIYTSSDVEFMKNLSHTLNRISETTQFDDDIALGFLQSNYAEIPFNYYNICIMSEKMFDIYYDDRRDDEHLFKDNNGNLIGMANQTHLYLLDGMSEEDRRYYILKGLLYSMGMHGTSFTDKESFFYRVDQQNKDLSPLDIESIKQLYGGGIKTGDNLQKVKETLGLPT